MENIDTTSAFAIFGCGLICGYWIGFGISGFSGRGNSFRAAEAKEVIAKLSPEALENVTDVLRGGRKIEAIKMIRAETNTGLREAKDAMEKLLADIR